MRCQLSPSELEQTLLALESKLERVGITTQPEVAIKILDLVKKPEAQVGDYAKILRTDAALAGRLLRVANSAFFAQLHPVTTLDRACVLLGIERLRAFSLGFYLAKSAASDSASQISRRTWGESVFRACLCAGLAKRLAPAVALEAFLIGLMLDAGIPLMAKFIGERYLAIDREKLPPAKAHHREFNSLPFSHVDIGTALARRWRLPPIIARPLMWHHTPPGDIERPEPEHVLHRICFYVGALELDQRTKTPREAAPLSALASRVIGCDEQELSRLVGSAAGEYKSTMSIFTGLAESMNDVENLPDLVHVQLTRMLDDTLTRAGGGEDRVGPARFRIGGCAVEITHDKPGWAMAFLNDAGGERIASARVSTALATPTSLGAIHAIRSAFSLESHADDEAAAMEEYLRKLAA